MKAFIRGLYNIVGPLFLAFLLFSIIVIISYFFSGIMPMWNCDYVKIPVKIDSYDRVSFGDGGDADISVGQFGTKRIKIYGYLQLDSVYYVWNCDKDDFSYLVKSKSETVKQYKFRKILYRFKLLSIVITINILLLLLFKFLRGLMKKYNISNKTD